MSSFWQAQLYCVVICTEYCAQLFVTSMLNALLELLLLRISCCEGFPADLLRISVSENGDG